MAVAKPVPQNRWTNLSNSTIGLQAVLKAYSDYKLKPENASELEYWANEPLEKKQVLFKHIQGLSKKETKDKQDKEKATAGAQGGAPVSQTAPLPSYPQGQVQQGGQGGTPQPRPQGPQMQSPQGQGGPTDGMGAGSGWDTYGGRLIDLGGGQYSYTNNDGTVHTGPVGDNYQDTTQAPTDVNWYGNNVGLAVDSKKNYYYVDKDTKTVRLIQNDQALRDLAGSDGNYNAAIAGAVLLDDSGADFLPSGALNGFTILGPTYNIQTGKQAAPLSTDPATVKMTYGKTPDQTTTLTATNIVEGWLSYLSNNATSIGISQDTILKASTDPTTLASYIGALAYGGYSPAQIFEDLKIQDMKNKGDASANGLQAINPGIDYSTFQKSDIAQKTYNLLSPQLPAAIGNVSASDYSKAFAQLGNDFSIKINPEEFDPTNPQMQAKMDAVQSYAYDALSQQLSANTAAEKAQADTNWQNTKSLIEKMYGWRLSDDALQAYGQIEKIRQGYQEANIAGSGLQSEATQDVLRQTRMGDERIRAYEQNTNAQYDQQHAMQYATSADINQMNLEDQAKGIPHDQWRTVQWGLRPKETDGVTAAKVVEQFRKEDPTSKMTDAQIKEQYYDPFYDINGNRYSQSQQANITNQFLLKYGYNPSTSAIPSITTTDASGQTQTIANPSYNQYKQATVYNKALSDMSKQNAWATPASATDPFSKPLPGSTLNPPTGATGSTPTFSAIKGFTSSEPGDSTNVDKTNSDYNPFGTGYQYIDSPSALSNYTNIKQKQDSNQLYGMPKTAAAPAVDKTNSSFNPFGSSYQYISSPSEMSKYSNIKQKQNSNQLYGVLKPTTP